MISKSKVHLEATGESYFEHMRFATNYGLLAMAAGVAALIHALIPALCTRTASRTVGLLGQLATERHSVDEVAARSVEAKAFVLLLILATIVVAPLWLLDAPYGVRTIYSLLAYALPAALLLTNRELDVEAA
jgi:hypothetical protein